jgi:hypothetical protein
MTCGAQAKRISSAPQASADVGNLLVDLRFRKLVAAADWRKLAPAVRRRFTQRLAAGNTIVYCGEIVETQLSRAGWWLAQAARLIGGPLPIAADAHAAAVVTVTEDAGRQVSTRLVARRNGSAQVVRACKRFAGPTGLEHYVGYGLGVALTVHVEAGALVFRGERYFLKVLGLRIRLPRWLTPGRLSVAHHALGERLFGYTLDLTHARLGTLVHQHAVFRETEQ